MALTREFERMGYQWIVTIILIGLFPAIYIGANIFLDWLFKKDKFVERNTRD